MKKSRTVHEFGEDYICTDFYDMDNDCSSIEVFRDGKYLGVIVDLEVPDDDDDVPEFEEKVIAWIENL
jgi:hypothetical protein